MSPALSRSYSLSCPPATGCRPLLSVTCAFVMPRCAQCTSATHSALLQQLLNTYPLESEIAQSCPTLWDPMDCSLRGSSIHGIFQARVLQWVAISFSGGSSQPRDQIWVSCIASRCFYCLSHKPMSLAPPALAGRFFTTEPPGKPTEFQFEEDDKVLQIDGLMVARQYQYTKCH